MQTVLDRVTITREGARQMRAYREGHIVTFNSNLRAQNIARGERGRVVFFQNELWELGYADQAHFIRDFRGTIGITPGAYTRARA